MAFSKKNNTNNNKAAVEEQCDSCSSNNNDSQHASSTTPKTSAAIDFAGNVVISSKLSSSEDHDKNQDHLDRSFSNKDQSTSGETYETDPTTHRDIELQEEPEIIPEEGDSHHGQEYKSKNNNMGGRGGGGRGEEEECNKVTVITDLSVYNGQTLEEQVDAFIAAYPVVMFQKTWCLFSIDAQQFMTEQMQVSVHTIELDMHPHGKAIQKHIQQRTGHNTVPVIYVKGEFLGGFEDVNQLYATGQLQDEYLKDLTQADRCEEFLVKSKIGIEPLFLFPAIVDAHVIRLTGILTCLSSLLAAISVHWVPWGSYIAYGIFFDFVSRLFAGSRFSVLGRIATLLTSPIKPKPRHGRPKQFATMCGVMFSGLGSFFYVMNFPNHDYVGTAFMGGLAIASGMEGFLDFCVGCVIFKYGIKLGLIPKG